MITINVLKIQQKFIDIYITAMKASDLSSYSTVDWWRENNPTGYQRSLTERRVNKAARYLLDEDGIFPTSILVNIRGRTEFIPATSLENYGELGILQIPKTSLPFYIIDGQHRLYAIRLAAREDPRLEDFALPISIVNFNNHYEEMRMFYIVNSRQKSVSTSLVLEHLEKTITEKGEQYVKSFETKKRYYSALAIPILKIVNSHPRSTWYNKVVLPNEKRRAQHIITQTSFADSIGIVLKTLSEDEILKIRKTPIDFSLCLINYWESLKEIYPEAFKDCKNYIIQKTHGCYVFQYLFIDIYKNCKFENDFSKEYMTERLTLILKRYSDENAVDALVSGFWHKDTGTPLGGMKAVKSLVDALRLHS